MEPGNPSSLPTQQGIDHAMIVVQSLETARRTYQRLGFSVTPRAVHPHGATENHLVLLQDSYLELLSVGSAAPTGTPFHHMLAQREGFWLAAMRTGNAETEWQRLDAIGATPEPPRTWSRTLHEGSATEVSFSTLFLSPQFTPEAGFFYCQHHQRNEVLDPVQAQHENGALDIRGAQVISEQPESLASDYARIFGESTVIQENGRLLLAWPGQEPHQLIEFLPEAALRRQYPGVDFPQPLKGPGFASMVITVESLEQTCEVLARNQVAFTRDRCFTRAWVQPEDACGVLLCFAIA